MSKKILTQEEKLVLLKQQIEGITSEAKASDDVETKWVAMDTAESWSWSQFIPSNMASNVINLVRDAQTVLSKLPTPINMPTATYTLPVEWVDPTFYATSENTAWPWAEYTASNAWTASIVLTAKKLTAVTYLSWELDEDSIVSIRPYVEGKLAKAYAEVIDKSIINWDTTTGSTWNVNKDDWTPATWTYYLHFSGLRKAAIDNSKTVNAWTLELADFRAARKLLWKKGLNPDKLLWIIWPDVYYKLLGLSQAETIEKFGSAATVVNWVISKIDWIEIVTNWDIPLTEADGKVSATGWNNTLWTAVLVYKEDIITWFKRDLRINVEYRPELDQFRITAHTRFALTIVATDSVASLINVTVA